MISSSASVSLLTDLAAISQQLSELTEVITRQTAVLDRLDARLADLSARSEWHDIQAAQMLRVIATALRQVRETQVYGLLSEGPVSAQALRDLLQSAALDPLPAILHSNEQQSLNPSCANPSEDKGQ